MGKRRTPKDITGMRSGMLVATKFAGKHKKHGREMWLCVCDCGDTKEIMRHNIVCGKSRSCGGYKHTSWNRWRGHGEISGNYFSCIRNAAKRRGREFTITMEYIWDLFLKQECKCALSGQVLRFTKHGPARTTQTASLDRIDSSKGYVPGNVQWLHKDINLMKQAYTDEYFMAMCFLVTNNYLAGVDVLEEAPQIKSE